MTFKLYLMLTLWKEDLFLIKGREIALFYLQLRKVYRVVSSEAEVRKWLLVQKTFWSIYNRCQVTPLIYFLNKRLN